MEMQAKRVYHREKKQSQQTHKTRKIKECVGNNLHQLECEICKGYNVCYICKRLINIKQWKALHSMARNTCFCLWRVDNKNSESENNHRQEDISIHLKARRAITNTSEQVLIHLQCSVTLRALL